MADGRAILACQGELFAIPAMKGRRMLVAHGVVVASGTVLLALAGCGLGSPTGSAPLTETRKAAVKQEVRDFVATVARDVTQEGPRGWQKHFADDPAFFMAVDGKMQFPNGQSAREGIEYFAHIFVHVQLNWGDDLRIDPLTGDLAQVATSWHEFLLDKDGHRTEESGFLTGLVEKRDGEWQFRNAHWSEAAPPKAP